MPTLHEESGQLEGLRESCPVFIYAQNGLLEQ
jgi:hypothetical protein